MPLHAAGRHYHGSTETVLDRALSSYSSSIRALIHARRRDSSLELAPRIREKTLLVAMEVTPGHSELRYASQEISTVRSVCKALEIEPVEPQPRKQDIISRLSQCKIFHFAGHGYTHQHDPSKSCLVIEDWRKDPLTLATLQETKLHEHAPFLAYLSACGTGRIGHERFLDENLHLISGYQMAGFRHVIGTLWEVSDKISVDVARITYESIKRGDSADDSVCRRLHKATKELRDRWLVKTTGRKGPKRQFKNTYRNSSKIVTEDFVVSNPDKDQPQPPRTILPDSDEDDEGDSGTHGPLLWVPYVHYGV